MRSRPLYAFELDPFRRRLLLEGRDELVDTLARLPHIVAWEEAQATCPFRA